MDSDGAMYIHSHYAKYPDWTNNTKCWVLIMEGGLRRSKEKFWGVNDPYSIATIDPPENRRFIVNADVFMIQCNATENNTVVWEKPFAGFYDPMKPADQLVTLDETPLYNRFGRKRKTESIQQPERFSIDVLVMESTSRTMFQRHMPRTYETMRRLGFDFFYGYNKMTDNSLVNLAPVLAGDIKEALENPKLDESGDINLQWILPLNKTLDPSDLPLLFNLMKEKFGCKTMLNDDISRRDLGLFHYPEAAFMNGFYKKPTDHFYKAFYCLIYNKWTYQQCKDGDQIQKEYLDIWYRFANKYKDFCHFGFTFITSLTHNEPFFLSLLDEYLNQRLIELNDKDLMDNSLFVIMADHGNRIGAIRDTYTGRIEEKAPLLSIRVPPRMRTHYPEQYKQFQRNAFKLTSNFDVHQTLRDVIEMKFGHERKDEGRRGISLFREISAERSCSDAYIPENFCSCLIDRSSIKETISNKTLPSQADIIRGATEAIRIWIAEQHLESCLDLDPLPDDIQFSILGINHFSRYGVQKMINKLSVEKAINGPPRMDYLYHEAVVLFQFKKSGSLTEAKIRIEYDVPQERYSVNFEPLVITPPTECPYKSILDVCECLDSIL